VVTRGETAQEIFLFSAWRNALICTSAAPSQDVLAAKTSPAREDELLRHAGSLVGSSRVVGDCSPGMRVDRNTKAWRLTKAGSSMPEIASITRRAQTFAAAAANLGAVTLLTVSGHDGIASYVSVPDRAGADKVALDLAGAVAARAEEVDELPDLSGTEVVGMMIVNAKSAAGRDSQKGDDPSETARRVEAALRTFGSTADDAPTWVAAVLRTAKSRERKRALAWYGHRLGSANPTHHSTDMNAVVVSILVGGASRDDVRQRINQIAAALPGFDVDVDTQILSTRFRAVITGGVGTGIGVGSLWLHQPPMMEAHHPLITATATAIGLLGAVGLELGLLPTRAHSLRKHALNAAFPAPRKRRGRPAPPRKAGGTEEKPIKESDGGYPLARDTFLVGPVVLVGLVAPHAGAASGSSVTNERAAPAAMLDPAIGMSIGTAEDKNVHLPEADLYTGVAIIGRPGSGKSVALRSMFAFQLLERRAGSGRPGFPGAANTLIAFESKGAEGADMYRRWGAAVPGTPGQQTVVVEVADPDTWAIDMFDVPGTLEERSRFFTNMLVYCFNDGAIMGRSYDALVATLSGALVVDRDIAEAAGVLVAADAITDPAEPGYADGLPGLRSPIFYAYLLLGGQGDPRGAALANAISDAAVRTAKIKNPTAAESARTEILADAENRLAPFYGPGVTPAQRRSLVEAARNKMADLMAAESWWSPKRRKVTWKSILEGHRSIVINTGVSTSGRQMEERTTGYFSAMLSYSLKDAIQRNCSGWRDQGRSVTIFSDELALLAGASPEVVTWFHDQGRSYGVRPIFATQRIGQLDKLVQESLLDYSTVFWFQEAASATAKVAVEDLVVDLSSWTTADVVGLPLYWAIIRTHVRGVRQTAVPVKLTNFEADMAGFGDIQGYGDSSSQYGAGQQGPAHAGYAAAAPRSMVKGRR